MRGRWTSLARPPSGAPRPIRRLPCRSPPRGRSRSTTPIASTRPAGIAPATVDPRFRNASLRSWNVNVQQQLSRGLAMMAGYFGSRGTDLRISRNINQPVNGVRPFLALSSVEPDSSGFAARQHHAGREQRLLELPRAVGVAHQTAVARAAVRHLVHLVEVARYQLAQFSRLRGAGQLRHPEPVRPVGLRRSAPLRAQRRSTNCRSRAIP